MDGCRSRGLELEEDAIDLVRATRSHTTCHLPQTQFLTKARLVCANAMIHAT